MSGTTVINLLCTHIEAGDLLVLSSRDKLSKATVETIKNSLAEQLPDVKVLFVDNLDVDVVKSDGS